MQRLQSIANIQLNLTNLTDDNYLQVCEMLSYLCGLGATIAYNQIEECPVSKYGIIELVEGSNIDMVNILKLYIDNKI